MCETSGGHLGNPVLMAIKPHKRTCSTSSSIYNFCGLWLIFCYMIVLCKPVCGAKLIPCRIKSGFYTITILDGDIYSSGVSGKTSNFLSTNLDTTITSFVHVVSSSGLSSYNILAVPNDSKSDHQSSACCRPEFINNSVQTANPWSGLYIHMENSSALKNTSQMLVISISHAASARLDVYTVDHQHVPPINVLKTPNQVYFVNMSKGGFDNIKENGDNFYSIKDGQLSVNLMLSSGVHIRPVPIVMATMKAKVSNMTASDDRIQEDIVDHVVTGLNIDKKNLMVNSACVQSCHQYSPISAFHIKISIGDAPVIQYNANASEAIKYNLSPSHLNLMTENLIKLVQTTSLESSTGLLINQISVQNTWIYLPEENVSLCLISKIKHEMFNWEVTYETPRSIKLCKSLVDGHKDIPLEIAPQVSFLNSQDNRITKIGPSSENSSWTVVASLSHPTSSAVLSGQLSVPVNEGIAKFSDLSIDSVGEGFRLNFEVFVSNNEGTKTKVNLTAESNTFNVLMRPLELKVSNVPYKAKEGEIFSPSPSVQIIDFHSKEPPSDTFIKKYEWHVSVYILDEEFFNGSQLMGTTSKTLVDTNFIPFTDLYLTKFGYQYRLKVEVMSKPDQYVLTNVIGPFDVERNIQEPRQIEETWVIQITFDGSYQSILPYKEAFFTYFLNNYGFRYDDVLWGNVSIRPGSVIANATISGTIAELQATTDSIKAEMGSSATFNGSTMSVAAVTASRPPVTEANTDEKDSSKLDGLGTITATKKIPDAWIVAIVLNVILGIIFIIVIIYWYKKHKQSSQRVYDSDAKVFEKTIQTNGNMENKAAGGGINSKQHGVFTIDVDEALDNQDNKSGRYSAWSNRRDSSIRDDDRLSYPPTTTNSDEDGYNESNSPRNHSRNDSRRSYSRTGSVRSRKDSAKSLFSRSRSDTDLRASSAQQPYYEERRNSSDSRRSSLRNESRQSYGNKPHAYDEREEDEHNREKYLLYEITGDSYRSRDYIAYIMLPQESPPTLTKTREYFRYSGTATAIQEIANLNFVFVRETGKQVSQALENSALVSDIFPNREIIVQIKAKGPQKKPPKPDPRGLKGFLKNNIVSKNVKLIHQNVMGVKCQNQNCDKPAVLKCTYCGKAPYCSNRCVAEDLRYHSAVCYKPPWKT